MPSIFNDQEIVLELVRTLENTNSALATYFRSLSKQQLKELFKNESDAFLQCCISQLIVLENYELCGVFSGLLSERQQTSLNE
jgi:hypothetical protein